MQPEQPTEPNEPKPAPETSEKPKPAKEHEESKAPPEPKREQDIHRVFWERTRLSRAIETLLVQVILWSFLGWDRGSFTGLSAIIPFAIVVGLLTYVLISVSKFGNVFDISIELLYGFSSLLAMFSTLYWNYGTAANFTSNLSRLDAVYFSVGTLSTAGTGNISAISQASRSLQTLQMILDIGFVVIAVSLAVAGISSRVQQRQG